MTGSSTGRRFTAALNYGPFIDAAIERARLSTGEVAKRVGVTEDAIRKWRRGEGVKLANLERLATALGVLPGDLLPNSGGGNDAFQSIAALMMGLSREDIRDTINALTSVAGVMVHRLRRAEIVTEHTAPSYGLGENSQKPHEEKRDPRKPFGVEGVSFMGEPPEPDDTERRSKVAPYAPAKRKTHR